MQVRNWLSQLTVRRSGGLDTLPASTPWNLDELSKPPAFEWDEGKQIRSLFYKGESYKGKPTRVFAYYATPGSLAGDPSLNKDLPGIVLVHGGGGTAFAKWAKLWASRGYAAIAMDLGIRGPAKQKFLADAAQAQKTYSVEIFTFPMTLHFAGFISDDSFVASSAFCAKINAQSDASAICLSFSLSPK